MTRAPEARDETVPMFSVVIPLAFHRDRWERCLQRWLAQSVAVSQYELLLVMPSAFGERSRLEALVAQAGSVCRLLVSDLKHDAELFAYGAAQARGQFLFFTESHCWPEPDVLALCLRGFAEHRDWAGFSCHSLPVTSSRLADAEAEMYGADITHSLTQHPWRKVLVHGFVTRREAYTRSGRFKPEFGHFAEWALAANFHALGMIIGYLPDACFHHQYTGELSELRRFTLDFVRGEIRYLADAASEPGSHLIELPVEWITQGNFDRSLARALLKRALHDARRGRDRARRREYLATAMRWLAPAIFGDRVRRAKSSIAVLAASIRVRFTKLFGSSRKLNGAFTTWVAALIHHQRLSSIATARKAKGRAGLHGSSRSPTGRLFAPDHAGFHPIESFQGTTFRWSETAAMVRIDLPAGLNRIEIECAPLFPLATLKELRFHLDGQDISDGDVPIESFRIVIDVGVDRAGRRTLGWTCRRFDAPGDPRVLGLPLAKIEVVAAT